MLTVSLLQANDKAILTSSLKSKYGLYATECCMNEQNSERRCGYSVYRFVVANIQILEEHKDALINIATALIEYETLTAEQIQKIVNGESIADDFAKKEVVAPKIELSNEAKEEDTTNEDEGAE